MKKIKKIIILIVLICVCALVYALFSNDDESDKFITTSVQKGDITKSVNAVGKIYAKNSVDLGAQVSGQVTKIYVKVGDKVKKGDLIAKIDDIKQKNKIEDIKASLNIQKAKLEAAQVGLDIALDKFAREQKLFLLKASSKDNLQNAKNALWIAKSRLNEIKEQIKQIEISLLSAKNDLQYTEITASMDGVVVSLLVKEGQTLNINQNTPLIAQIADLSQMEIRVEIPESDINQVKVGQKAIFKTISQENGEFESIIDSIDLVNTSYTEQNANRSNTEPVYYYAKIYVKNDTNILKIAMTVEVSIIISQKKDILMLPSVAIKSDKNGKFVLIKGDKNAIEKKYIQIGLNDGINCEIISNLDPNSQIITEHLSKQDLANLINENSFEI